MASIQLISVDDPRMTPPIREEWQDKAACAGRDREMFFPGVGGSTLEAKAICAGCDVRFECLEYALKGENNANKREGIFGGLSGLERKRLVKLMQNTPSMTLEDAYDVITSSRVKKVSRKNKAA